MSKHTMSNTSTWTMALILLAGGCEAADAVEVDGEISLRDDDYPLGKLNTNFLGIDQTLPLDAIPLVYDENAPVRLHSVWTQRCRNPMNGQLMDPGLYYTSDIDGDLGISVVDGDLQPTTFRLVDKPWVTCVVSEDLWEETVWEVITRDEQGVEEKYYMMILDRGSDVNQERVYKWGVLTGPELFNPSNYAPTCIEDSEPLADLDLVRFHAYLIDDLAVDPTSGDFSQVPDQIFIACLSGAVGKSAFYGYYPWEVGAEYHELATRMIRADYCGTGFAHTKPGTPVQIHDSLGINDFDDPNLDYEAGWDLQAQAATCLSTPRYVYFQEHPEAIACSLPLCDNASVASDAIVTRVAQ
ncbi:MAG: hypothetical protein H6710_00495 [Myxococcales bacterium]|nr:hypothetical protein [Myxococcales bacterium]MCB9703146.1 hypothetical protein [Myxococcales bacterium]